jgi:hypothetical protein
MTVGNYMTVPCLITLLSSNIQLLRTKGKALFCGVKTFLLCSNQLLRTKREPYFVF